MLKRGTQNLHIERKNYDGDIRSNEFESDPVSTSSKDEKFEKSQQFNMTWLLTTSVAGPR